MDRNYVEKCFEKTLGMRPRAIDTMVVMELAKGSEDISEVLGEYIWDHWLGEPDAPTMEEVIEICRECAKQQSKESL